MSRIAAHSLVVRESTLQTCAFDAQAVCDVPGGALLLKGLWKPDTLGSVQSNLVQLSRQRVMSAWYVPCFLLHDIHLLPSLMAQRTETTHEW